MKKISKLVIASHNKGKIREIDQLLQPFDVEVLNGGEMIAEEPVEDADSFIGNAKIKSDFFCNATKLPSLADDSGLVVPALAGAPGVYSARWAEVEDGAEHTEITGTSKRDFNMAMQKVADALIDATGTEHNHAAYFACALSLTTPDGEHVAVEGRVNGKLVFPQRGEDGFGYDAIFQPNGHKITFAEMESASKQNISHRADAFAKLIDKVFK